MVSGNSAGIANVQASTGAWKMAASFARCDAAVDFLKDGQADLLLVDCMAEGGIGSNIEVPVVRFTFREAGPGPVAEKNPDIVLPCAPEVFEKAAVSALRKKASRQEPGDAGELSAVFEQAPMMMILIGADGKTVRMNGMARKFAGLDVPGHGGLTTGESMGCTYAFGENQSCGEGAVCEACSLRMAVFETLQTGRSFYGIDVRPSQLAARHKEDVALVASTFRVGTPERPLALLCLEDVSFRKQSDERVREQSILLDMAQEAMLVLDLAGHVVFWNSGAEHLYGWKLEEVINQEISTLLFKGGSTEFAQIHQTLTQRGDWNGELHHMTKDQREVIMQSRWTLVVDRAGRPKSIFLVMADVTEQKRLQSQYLRAQRLETVGTLASGLAHDLNNVLSPILMAVQFLSENIRDPQCQSVLHTLESNTQRGAGIIRQLLTFGRGISGDRIVLNPKHLLQDMAKIGQETFPKNIELHVDYPGTVWSVNGDATQLHQVLLNLCVNAKDAMPSGGKLGLKLENQRLDDVFTQMRVDARPGLYSIITISDTGTGIPPGIIDRIFDPFFTTKSPGKGTGIGLATVASIVKNHGGFVTVRSEVGKGSQFKVFLPAMESEASPQTAAAPAHGPRGHNEMILVVDDEKAVRDVTSRILSMNGYRVITARNGAEALTAFAHNETEVKLIVMDLLMPAMDGASTVKVLQKYNNHVPVVIVSGMVNPAQEAILREQNVQAILPKPFTAEKLLSVIHDSLAHN